MIQIDDQLKSPLCDLLLSVADDKLFLGHRNADWTGLAPILEEDIAFSSLSQDELAHATALYQLVSELRGTTANALAFGRRPEEYRNTQLVEFSDEFDWAVALCRSLFCDHFDALRLNRLAKSSYKPLAQLAARLAAEEQVHIDHADSWVTRLGRGGKEANERMQSALDRLAPLAPSLFEPTAGVEKLEAAGIYPGSSAAMFADWSRDVMKVVGDAGLRLTIPSPTREAGGRRGMHSDAFGPMLDELTEVYRLEPGAAW